MAFTTPCITDKYTAYTGDVISSNFSFAIWPINDYMKNKPIGRVQVEIIEIGRKAFRNLSGYYYFTDLKVGNYTVNINSELYFPQEITIDTSKIKIFDVILEFNTDGPAAGDTSTKLKDVSSLQIGDIIELHNPAGNTEKKSITSLDASGTISWTEGLEHDFNTKGSNIIALKNPAVSILLKPLPYYPFPNNATLVRGVIFDSNKKPVNKATVNVTDHEIEAQSDEKGEFVLYFNEIKDANVAIQIRYNGMVKTKNVTLEKSKTISIGKIVLS